MTTATTKETMMQPTDYKPYADALANQTELRDALEKAQARHRELSDRLANIATAEGYAAPDPLQVAIATARGLPTGTRVDELERLRSEVAALSTAIGRLERGLADATERVNIETRRAQAAAYRAQGEALEKLRKDWIHSVDAMLRAVEAEDALLAELVTRGFCTGDAVITRPHDAYVSRERLRDFLASERTRLFNLKG